jgi:hypothetical protein
MLRDSNPATSGCAVCSLDTDSSGVAVAPSSNAARRSAGGSGRSSLGGSASSSGGAEQPATFAVNGGAGQALAQVMMQRVGWLSLAC